MTGKLVLVPVDVRSATLPNGALRRPEVLRRIRTTAEIIGWCPGRSKSPILLRERTHARLRGAVRVRRWICDGCSWPRSSPHSGAWGVNGPCPSPATRLPVRDFGVISEGVRPSAILRIGDRIFPRRPVRNTREVELSNGVARDAGRAQCAREISGFVAARDGHARGPRRGSGEAREHSRTLTCW